MKERPILFSSPMVRKLLVDAKTQTRRIVGPQQPKTSTMDPYQFELTERDGSITAYTMKQLVESRHNRYGVAGDRLWVRETHAVFSVGEGMDRLVPECVAYRATCADDNSFDYINTRGELMGLTVTKWTPSIFMPRWASRITLDITNIRVERLHDITEADARAEGVTTGEMQDAIVNGEPGRVVFFDAKVAFAHLWAAINGAESWKANPLVWVVEFKRVADQARAA